MNKKSPTFNEEELEIIDAIEHDKLESAPFTSRDREALRLIARNTLAKTRTINIRLSERDLLHIKTKAATEGIPYQTLVASVLHKYGSQV